VRGQSGKSPSQPALTKQRALQNAKANDVVVVKKSKPAIPRGAQMIINHSRQIDEQFPGDEWCDAAYEARVKYTELHPEEYAQYEAWLNSPIDEDEDEDEGDDSAESAD
jgi:hypothetical protein